MDLFIIKCLPFFSIFVTPSTSKAFNSLRFSGPSENVYDSAVPDCYNKFMVSEGTIHSPVLLQAYQYPVDCLWEIDVTDSYTLKFEFEKFRLPKSGDHKCESYVEMSYMKNQNEMTKRLFCPYDLVDKVFIDSSKVHLRFHSDKYIEEYGSKLYGFNINFKAIPVDRLSTNYAATIVLASFATLFIITVCVICIRSQRKIGPIPSHVTIPAPPNAPTRADLESAFDFHLRELTQAPKNGGRYMSRTCPNLSDFPDRRSVSNPPQNTEPIIVTTPRCVFPASRLGLNPDSARRIADLRTRLVARFSSASSNDLSDRSVFLSASSQMNYSQLSSEEDQEEEKVPEGEVEQRRRTTSSGRKRIPSIVIEYYK